MRANQTRIWTDKKDGQRTESGKRDSQPAQTSGAETPTPNEQAGRSDPAKEPYIGKAEVARRLGRTVRTVDKLMNKGRIPFYKFDWRVAFRWSEVQAHFSETCRVCRRNEVKR